MVSRGKAYQSDMSSDLSSLLTKNVKNKIKFYTVENLNKKKWISIEILTQMQAITGVVGIIVFQN